MSQSGRTQAVAARNFHREFRRLLDELDRRGMFRFPGAAEALLDAGAETADQDEGPEPPGR